MSDPRHLPGKLELVPVVEFSPGPYSDRPGEPYPEGSSRDNPEGWHRWWAERMADGGLADLEPLRPGSWLVPAERLTRPQLRTMMLAEFRWREVEPASLGVNLPEDEEFFLYGGYTLVHDGEVLIEPQCCCDLANLAEWRNVVANPPPGWFSMWIGHPSVDVLRVSDCLQLNPETERGSVRDGGYLVEIARLVEAVREAELWQRRFAERLAEVLGEWAPPDAAARVAEAMAGLKGHG